MLSFMEFVEAQPSLTPAIKNRRTHEVLAARPGEDHGAILRQRFGTATMTPPDWEHGYVDEKKQFLDRFKAFQFAKDFDLIKPERKGQDWFFGPGELPSEFLKGSS